MNLQPLKHINITEDFGSSLLKLGVGDSIIYVSEGSVYSCLLF